MSVDHPTSGDNSFSSQALNQALYQNAQQRQLGYEFSSPLGNNLLGAYSRDQIIGMLAEQLAKAPPNSATISGKNGLFRINWFDGRFLTAQAFRQQDSYWDQRLRLLAQIFPPGISWGLGLAGVQATLQSYPPRGADNAYQRAGGVSLDTPFSLRPGVAFDGLGRPIVVGQEFGFCFRDLIPRFQAEPRQVAASGQRFQSCLCLEPFNGGAGTPGSAVPPGPYLLMIEPRESPEGDAKVYGEVCAGAGPARCESNGWRGGFGLSLVRFPADPPSELNIASAWDLRGILSAYYYDVFEHSLIGRWDPEFARDDGFCAAVGNACQQAGAVPLAMAYIGFDGSLLFLDQWIPRRGLAASNAANWTRAQIGAPLQAAADARLHQFQCMLRQSLSQRPLAPVVEQNQAVLNLHDRGFRHIPPVGFLPFEPDISFEGRATDAAGNTTNFQDLFAQIPALANLAQVEQQIDRYFCGTSVVPYYVVALHDDDVLEDINNAFHKDPVRVDRLSAIDDRLTKRISDLCQANADGNPFSTLFTRFFKTVSAVFQVMLADTDLLVNRDIELVKVVIPLQGLKRKHPITGVTDLDTQASWEDWYRRAAPADGNLFSDLTTDLLTRFLRQRFGMDALPRHFAVYVKQRMVLLDAIYLAFELFNQIMAFIRTAALNFDMQGTESFLMSGIPTENFRMQRQSLPPVQLATAQAALKMPLVREVVAFSAITTNRELASPQMWDSFFKQVDVEDARLAEQIEDPVLRRQHALDLVTDAQAEETPGFEAVKLLVAVQDPVAAEASLRRLQSAAAVAPALDERGLPRDLSLNQQVLHGGGLRVFENENSRELWRAVQTGLKQQPAGKLAGTETTAETVEEVLKKSPGEAERTLGGSDKLEELRKNIAPKVDKIAKEIDAVAAEPPAPEVARSFEKNLTAANGDPVKALTKTQAEFKNDAKATASLKRIKPMAELLGKEGFEPVAGVVFRRPG